MEDIALDYTLLLKNFLDGQNRLKALPAKRKTLLYAVGYLAEKLVPGRTYTESEVNDLLDLWHTFHDPATLRRELYQNHYLNRTPDGSAYWAETSEQTPSTEES